MKLFRQAWRQALLILVTTYISGCANFSETHQKTANELQDGQVHLAKIATIKDFKLSGRVAVNANNQGSSGAIHWEHNKAKGIISFYSPLGGKVADFSYSNQNVKFTNQDHKTFEADNAETLSETFRLALTTKTSLRLGAWSSEQWRNFKSSLGWTRSN